VYPINVLRSQFLKTGLKSLHLLARLVGELGSKIFYSNVCLRQQMISYKADRKVSMIKAKQMYSAELCYVEAVETRKNIST